jgi:hypothetical protein
MASCKILTKRGGTKAQSAICGPLGPLFYEVDKANTIADSLDNQFTVHDLCDCDYRQQVKATVQALLHTTDEGTPVEFHPCDILKEGQYLKLGKAHGLDGIPN